MGTWVGSRSSEPPTPGGLRFAFYGRGPTEDFQDPASSRGWQLLRAQALVAGHGRSPPSSSTSGTAGCCPDPAARKPPASSTHWPPRNETSTRRCRVRRRPTRTATCTAAAAAPTFCAAACVRGGGTPTGLTIARPTAAATAAPAPPAPAGHATPTSARTASWPTCPLCYSASPKRRAGGSRSGSRPAAGRERDADLRPGGPDTDRRHPDEEGSASPEPSAPSTARDGRSKMHPFLTPGESRVPMTPAREPAVVGQLCVRGGT